MSITLHIERLVLDQAVLGGEPASKVRAELERELQRQLALSGAAHVLPGIGSVSSLSSCGPPEARPARGGVGERIAAEIRHALVAETAAHAADIARVNGGRHG